MISPDGDPSTRLLREALPDEIEQALSELDPALRETLILHEVEGFSYEEIGEAMDAPIGTVGSRLARARTALARRLKAYAQTRGYALAPRKGGDA